jgi:hypothetical protein
VTDESPPRLPDFIFGRDGDREAADGLHLAGVLVTDFAKPEDQLTQTEWREIEAFIDQLVAAAYTDTALYQAGYWRNQLPPDRHTTLFPDEAVKARMVGHLVLSFDVDRAGMVCVTSSGCAPTRAEVDENVRRGMN